MNRESKVNRAGPIEVLQEGLDVKGQMPVDLTEKIYATWELRALRPWEEFTERIIRWRAHVNVGAIAAQLGAIQFTAPQTPTGPGGIPKDSIIIFDGAKNRSSIVVDVMLGAPAVGGAPSAGSPNYADQGWGPAAAPVPIGYLTGQQAAGGVQIDVLDQLGAPGMATPNNDPREGYFIMRAGGDTLSFRGVTVNTALQLQFWGRLVMPRL